MKARIIFILFILLFLGTESMADKIVLKDARAIKGVIVENYLNRIVLSTFEGEKTILKSEIARIDYDSLETNFLDMAEQYKDKKDFQSSFFYYDKAHKLNSDSRAAKNGLAAVRQILFKKEQLIHESEVKKKSFIEEFRRTGHIEENTTQDKDSMLRDKVGIVIELKGVNPEIVQVINGSAADESGILKGDKVVAIWSRLAGYLDKDEVVARIINPMQRELKLTIQRKLVVKKKDFDTMRSVKDIVGAVFLMKWDGLTIDNVIKGEPGEDAGLREGDLVVGVMNRPTRYMSLDKFNNTVKGSDGELIFTIRRDVTIWKR